MKKALLLLIISIFFYSSSELISQQISEDNLNPDFINYLDLKAKGQIKKFTSDGHPLGLIPHPVKKNTNKALKTKKDKDIIQAPPQFDLRNVSGTSYVSPVKNQGSCGSCWAFATLGSFESQGMVSSYGTEDFSEQSIKNCHGFEWGPCYGGNDDLSTSYLSRLDGPVYESDDPYNVNDDVCQSSLSARTFVTKAINLPGRSTTGYEETIKNYIINNGALYTTMMYEGASYNYSTRCYRYTGTSSANHAVTLVGWDDYKDMSSVGATTPGAWIIKNSWGLYWGENGYFYISYEDSKINGTLACWPQRISYDGDAKLYHYDELGGVSRATSGSSTSYGLVKFIATDNLQIAKISSWITSASTDISVEIFDDFVNGSLQNSLGSISTQSCDYPGYYTFDLSSAISVSAGDDYYVKITYNSTTTNYTLPIERVITGYCTPTIESGIGWISGDGSNWTAIGSGTSYAWDLCIRAYTVAGGNSIAAPDIISPKDNEEIESTVPQLDWTDVTGADYYEVQLSAASDFSNPVINLSNISISEYSVPANTLNPDNHFYWRVRAVGGGQTSGWASTDFTIIVNLSAPALVIPDNLAVVAINPGLDWSASDNAISYTVQVADNNSFLNPVVDQSELSSTEYNVPDNNLNYNTKYYWRVKAVARFSVSAWSNREFTTEEEIVPLLPPTLTSPANLSTGVSVVPNMNWSDVDNADSYGLQVSTDQSFSNIILDETGITLSQYQIGSDLLDYSSTYYWRVNTTVGSETSEWSGEWRFTTLSIPTPSITYPANRAVNVALTPTLNWQDVENADSYNLLLSDSRKYKTLILNVSCAASSYSIPSGTLNNQTKYYWKVQAVNGSNTSDWANASFTTVAPTANLTAPTLLSPSNNTRNGSVTLSLDWSDVSAADSYSLQVSSSSKFSSFVIDESGITSSGYDIPSGTLNYSTRYYWRVKSHAGSETSVWSGVFKFTTRKAKLADPDLGPNIFSSMSLYPNPTSDYFSLNLELQEKSDLSIHLSDMLGRTIFKDFEPGVYEYSENIDLRNCQPGTYFLKLQTGDKFIVRKIVKY